VSLFEAGAVAASIWDKALREADDLSRQVAPVQYALYAGLMAKVREEVSESVQHASPVDAVVKAVEHAMMVRNPKTRYLIGRDSWLGLLLSFLPNRWRDRLILSKINQ
jgi:hypothetical protein